MHHHRYFAYNLHIRSEIELPELPGGSALEPPDLVIQLASVDKPVGLDASGCVVTEGEYRFWAPGWACLANRERVLIQPNPAAPSSTIRTALIGHALPVVLEQRGCLPLHASSVEIDQRAVLLLGDSGRGKSTLAAALYRRGHRLVSDDLSAVDLSDSAPTVLPGAPCLKLSAAALSAIDGHASGRLKPMANVPLLRKPDDGLIKQLFTADEGFSPTAVPIGAIYLLDVGQRQQLTPLAPAQAAAELLRHSAVVRATAVQYLDHCARVVEQVPTKRLVSDRQLSTLPQLAALVEQDCRSHL